MNEEQQGFSLSEMAVWLLLIVLTIQVGSIAYNMGKSVAAQPFPNGKGGATAGALAETDAKPINGTQLYVGNCGGCHGGKGEGGLGPSLQAASAWALADFSKATLHGSTPDGRELAPVMPRFADAGLDGAPAEDAQLEAIHNYLKTLY